MRNQSICLNANINPSNQYEMRRDDLKKFATLSRLCQCPIQLFATIDSHTIIAKQKCNDQIWMTGRGILQEIMDKQSTWTWWIKTWPPNLNKWKRNLAREARPTIDLNLMNNQSTCLNASITLSVLPIMMQTQIRATNMRWEETTLKSLQLSLVPMPNTTICHKWLSHYNCQTEMWSPNSND